MNELPSTAFGVMRLLPDTKTGIEAFSKQLVASVQNGEVNPLQLKALFKIMEKVAEKVDAGIKDNLLTEAAKYSEKKFVVYGCEIERAEVGVKYDYAVCSDPIYDQRHAQVESAKTLLDERAAFLKALKEPLTIVCEESGEVVTVRPPLKRGTEGLKFTIK